jgi:hypothetical protein
MIYELRTYWAAPGKRDALHKRFRTTTLNVFARHQMQIVAFWTPSPITEESGDLVYLLAFPNREALTAAWDAMRADQDWQQAKAATETDGALTAKITSVTLEPTPYSPLQ